MSYGKPLLGEIFQKQFGLTAGQLQVALDRQGFQGFQQADAVNHAAGAGYADDQAIGRAHGFCPGRDRYGFSWQIGSYCAIM